ncbi:hypothetical protein MIND_00561500 [Mycena indigotica]|uniref:Uncharacterized protein n=1 Tax=Mycena indigotica TaxID=2126181 RepID=A0A8H6SQH4_9AGAR|nr:uncharacterized protein MIND_00561500 [Mycena indigotica]KAF7303338.1 hypothetical protein MIND_00561500 [Mycena indigotica]
MVVGGKRSRCLRVGIRPEAACSAGDACLTTRHFGRISAFTNSQIVKLGANGRASESQLLQVDPSQNNPATESPLSVFDPAELHHRPRQYYRYFTARRATMRCSAPLDCWRSTTDSSSLAITDTFVTVLVSSSVSHPTNMLSWLPPPTARHWKSSSRATRADM